MKGGKEGEGVRGERGEGGKGRRKEGREGKEEGRGKEGGREGEGRREGGREGWRKGGREGERGGGGERYTCLLPHCCDVQWLLNICNIIDVHLHRNIVCVLFMLDYVDLSLEE